MKKFLIIAVAVGAFLAALSLIYKVTHLGLSKHTAVSKLTEPSALLREADRRIAAGDTAGAIEDLGILIGRSPESPQAELALLGLGTIYTDRGQLRTARESFQRLVDKFPASNNVGKAQEGLEQVNIKALFSPLNEENALFYEVRQGDTLHKLAKRFGTTMDLIAKTNGIKGAALRTGRKLKITKCKFSIVVDKAQSILTLKADGAVFKTYRVSTGLNNSTPAGTFKIVNRIASPTWWKENIAIPSSSPKNILGSHWLGISKQGYGIHGTTDPGAIGTNVTAGCVRMKNVDVEQLFTIVPEGTEVVIID